MHSAGMDGPTLFAKLLQKHGLNPTSLATAINRKSAQSGFDRFLKGLIDQPKTKADSPLSAAAKLFGINVVAFIDPALADKEWERISRHTNNYRNINATPEESEITRNSYSVEIKQFDTGGAMGGGFVLKEQPGIIRRWEVNQEWIHKNLPYYTSIDNLAIVTGFGDSMLGMFNPGDPILVDRGITKCDVDGVYFFRVDGEGFIKRLQRIPGEGVLVISENAKYRDWTIKEGMNFQVLAKVLTVWRSERF